MKIILRGLFAPVLLALAAGLAASGATQAQPAAVCEQPVTVQAGDTLSTLATFRQRWLRAHRDASNAAAALDASFAPIQDPT